MSSRGDKAEPVVRDAAPGDADAIAAIHVAAWEFAYRESLPADVIDARTLEQRQAYWRELLAAPVKEGEFVLVVVAEGRVRGFAHCAPSDVDGSDPKKEARWHSIYLDPQALGRGLAHALRLAVSLRLEELGYETFVFWTVASNARAQAWFLRARPTGDERTVEEGRVKEVLWRGDVAEYVAVASAPRRESS